LCGDAAVLGQRIKAEDRTSRRGSGERLGVSRQAEHPLKEFLRDGRALQRKYVTRIRPR